MERILMLVAHPDDEALFGFHDLFYNDVTVICFTNGTNKVRRAEFELSAKTFGFKPHMLNYRDSEDGTRRPDTWQASGFYEKHIMNLVKNNTYDMVVSHDANGEYGHIQHRQTHVTAIAIAATLQLPFADFASRWSLAYTKELVEAKQRIPLIYKSQAAAVGRYMNYFESQFTTSLVGRDG